MFLHNFTALSGSAPCGLCLVVLDYLDALNMSIGGDTYYLVETLLHMQRKKEVQTLRGLSNIFFLKWHSSGDETLVQSALCRAMVRVSFDQSRWP